MVHTHLREFLLRQREKLLGARFQYFVDNGARRIAWFAPVGAGQADVGVLGRGARLSAAVLLFHLLRIVVADAKIVGHIARKVITATGMVLASCVASP